MERNVYSLCSVEYVIDGLAEKRYEALKERLGDAVVNHWVDTDDNGRLMYLFNLDSALMRNTYAHNQSCILGYITHCAPAIADRCNCTLYCTEKEGHDA